MVGHSLTPLESASAGERYRSVLRDSTEGGTKQTNVFSLSSEKKQVNGKSAKFKHIAAMGIATNQRTAWLFNGGFSHKVVMGLDVVLFTSSDESGCGHPSTCHSPAFP
jgi:hypothetical protein